MGETTHTIINGDSRRMAELSDNAIDLIVTSPPYWQLKDYGSRNDIGFNHSYEDYINHLSLVWQEAYRVLDHGRRLCINVGDQYARAFFYGRYKVIPIQAEIIKFCETIGFDYMGAIIWQKIATTHTSGGGVIMGSFPYPGNGILKLDYEFILIFKKNGAPSRKVSREIKIQSKLTTEEWNAFFDGHWHIPGAKQQKHLAAFPLEIPRRLIRMFSFIGETVLDPFAGSGTTACAAMELNRQSVGYEINPDFIPLIREKLPIIEKKQESIEIDFEAAIQCLPYRFKDPVKLNPVIDPRTVDFGSKIARIDKRHQTESILYYGLKEILSPERIILKNKTNNAIRVRLTGIKENPEKRDEAMAFLERKLKKARLFLRFDAAVPITETINGEEWTFAYLYLRNKTFINAHLIKENLVCVDQETEFKYKKKFLNLKTL
ncbi:MAG: DNA-methyltransferase [Candidatus Omnitrophota bacterium]